MAYIGHREFDSSKVNVNGGAIAFGHPVGATGTILTIKAMYELDRMKGRYGLVTMCIGGGQGIAMALERVSHCRGLSLELPIRVLATYYVTVCLGANLVLTPSSSCSLTLRW